MKYFAALLAIISIGFISSLTSTDASAANRNDFNPGYIVDDYVFYNSGAMDAGQIQNFLNSKNPNCDYWGTQPASDWGRSDITHAQLAEYKRNGTNGYSRDSGFHAPPYRCLTMYSQSTPQMEAASGYCNAISAGTRTAAQIINDVAKACGINPQVLIILLEKEQSLITDDWPLNRQLQKATGFACPDTAPCNPAYEGFFYQVYNAARQFKVYQAFPNNYNYRAGRSNNVYWHPDLSRCGSSSVYIQNQATAALYIYTPYRPNDAALNNLYGTGDSCSSYGNRNFWRIFTDWFGSTKVSYQSIDTPRWLTLTAETYKKTPGTGQDIINPGDTPLAAGTQLKFVSKVYLGGQWYFRTQFDHDNGLNRGIPATIVREIVYEAFTTPRWMTVAIDTTKFHAAAQKSYGGPIPAGTNLFFVSKVSINGQWYFRTEYDNNSGAPYAIPADRITETQFIDFESPRFMQINTTTRKINPITNQAGTDVVAGSQFRFNKKVLLGNKTYYQIVSDNGLGLAIDSSHISEISFTPAFEDTPTKWLVLNKQTQKINPTTELEQPGSMPQGLQVQVSEKISVDGKIYYRTAYDKSQNSSYTISGDDLDEISWIPLEEPRSFKLLADTKKVFPKTGEELPATHYKGAVISFQTKIYINGTWYLRTSFDTERNSELGIPLALLGDI